VEDLKKPRSELGSHNYDSDEKKKQKNKKNKKTKQNKTNKQKKQYHIFPQIPEEITNMK